MKRQNGSALMETAIVLPLWIVLFIGTVETSLMFKEYAAINQATEEALRAGMRSQCSIQGCDMTKILPFETGPKTFDESVDAIECLNDNSKPDCGRIIMAWNAFKVFQSMKSRGEHPKATIEIQNGYAIVTVTATYLPIFSPSLFQIRRTETGPYGHTLSY